MKVNCKGCNKETDNTDIWYDPNHPQIDIGPYCPECFLKVGICKICRNADIRDNMFKIQDNPFWFVCKSCLKVEQ